MKHLIYTQRNITQQYSAEMRLFFMNMSMTILKLNYATILYINIDFTYIQSCFAFLQKYGPSRLHFKQRDILSGVRFTWRDIPSGVYFIHLTSPFIYHIYFNIQCTFLVLSDRKRVNSEIYVCEEIPGLRTVLHCPHPFSDTEKMEGNRLLIICRSEQLASGK